MKSILSTSLVVAAVLVATGVNAAPTTTSHKADVQAGAANNTAIAHTQKNLEQHIPVAGKDGNIHHPTASVSNQQALKLHEETKETKDAEDGHKQSHGNEHNSKKHVGEEHQDQKRRDKKHRNDKHRDAKHHNEKQQHDKAHDKKAHDKKAHDKKAHDKKAHDKKEHDNKHRNEKHLNKSQHSSEEAKVEHPSSVSGHASSKSTAVRAHETDSRVAVTTPPDSVKDEAQLHKSSLHGQHDKHEGSEKSGSKKYRKSRKAKKLEEQQQLEQQPGASGASEPGNSPTRRELQDELEARFLDHFRQKYKERKAARLQREANKKKSDATVAAISATLPAESTELKVDVRDVFEDAYELEAREFDGEELEARSLGDFVDTIFHHETKEERAKSKKREALRAQKKAEGAAVAAGLNNVVERDVYDKEDLVARDYYVGGDELEVRSHNIFEGMSAMLRTFSPPDHKADASTNVPTVSEDNKVTRELFDEVDVRDFAEIDELD